MYKTLQRLRLDKAETFYFGSETEIERFSRPQTQIQSYNKGENRMKTDEQIRTMYKHKIK